MKLKKYYVYEHVNKINGKKYIGITCQRLNKRWLNGNGYKDCTRFYNAIQKYGWLNFEHNILYQNISQEDACYLLQTLITLLKTNDKNFGYNICSGGEHPEMSELTKRKISLSSKGKIFSDETKIKMSLAHKGKHISELTKEKMSLSKKGKKIGPHSELRKKKIFLNNVAKIKVLCVETNIIYESIRDAERNTGIDHSCILRCCKGKQNVAGGYHWIYC